MTKEIDFDRYAQFVDGVTSSPSQDFDAFIYRPVSYTHLTLPTNREV